jgi:Lar family restriction alleviation protein
MKPCPFCGCDEVTRVEERNVGWYILCAGCRAAGPVSETQEEAEDTWDIRSGEGI